MDKNPQGTKKIPAVGKLLEESSIRKIIEEYGREQVTFALRAILADVRKSVLEDRVETPSIQQLTLEVEKFLKPNLLPVINATGILIHTHLGRAPLPGLTPRDLQGYCTLEMDLKDGSRGNRNFTLEPLLSRMSGAESALVVNNNAAAVFLLLKTWCEGKEVLISRGELVEIGGSFRIPEILKEGGAILREVGTTNRTHLKDFHAAITDDTAAILRIHPSNYRILGFTAIPGHDELADLAHKHGLQYFVDQGCGVIDEISFPGIEDEVSVQDLLKSGADAVCFSGDKLLGGTQAGITVGKKKIIGKMLYHPLYRTFRPGKETFLYLAETLQLILSGKIKEVPLHAMASTPLSTLRGRARRLISKVKNDALSLRFISSPGQFGGGTTPLVEIPSIAVEVVEKQGKDENLFKHLLQSDPPVVAVHREGRVYLNLLSVLPDQVRILAETLNAYQ